MIYLNHIALNYHLYVQITLLSTNYITHLYQTHLKLFLNSNNGVDNFKQTLNYFIHKNNSVGSNNDLYCKYNSVLTRVAGSKFSTFH